MVYLNVIVYSDKISDEALNSIIIYQYLPYYNDYVIDSITL